MKTNWVIVLGLTLFGCGSVDPLIERVHTVKVATGDLEIETIYGLPPFTDSPIPVYLRIVNHGSAADSLLSVSSPAAEQIMMHGGDMSAMEVLPIPAGQSLVMEPGGLHLMLMPPTPRLVRGDSVEISLSFAQSGEVTFVVPVIAHVDVDAVRN